jgi:hypothetical protein
MSIVFSIICGLLLLEFSFGDRVQSYGLPTNGSPNYEDFRLNSESIWKDAVEYSSMNITMEQCLFQNVEWFSTESSHLPSGSVKLDLDENFGAHANLDTSSSNRRPSFTSFPISTSQNECVIQNFEGTTTQDCDMLSGPEQEERDFSEKRVRNNEACKKFRKARKGRHEQLYIMEEKMLKENSFLKSRISALEKEIEKWKDFFSNQK